MSSLFLFVYAASLLGCAVVVIAAFRNANLETEYLYHSNNLSQAEKKRISLWAHPFGDLGYCVAIAGFSVFPVINTLIFIAWSAWFLDKRNAL